MHDTLPFPRPATDWFSCLWDPLCRALHTSRLPAPTAQCSAGYHPPRPAGEVDAPRDEWEGRHRGEDVRHLHHHRAAGVAVRIPRYLDVDRYPDSLTLDEGSDVRLGRAAAARGTAYHRVAHSLSGAQGHRIVCEDQAAAVDDPEHHDQKEHQDDRQFRQRLASPRPL